MSAKRALSWLQTGWNLIVDPGRERRLDEYTAKLHKELAALKVKFRFSEATDRLGIDPDDRAEVRRRLFGRCVAKAWSDGELSDQETRSLKWIADALGFQEAEATAEIQAHALRVFSSTMAAAFVDGVLDDTEHAHLERIARSCGASAAGFFRNQFRHDGEGFLRNLFISVWEVGRVDASEWEAIQTTTRRLGLTNDEFRGVIRAPAQQLVEHFLADFKSDQEITPDEQRTLEWMLEHLIDDQLFAEYVRDEISRGTEIARIRRGVLPSVMPPTGVALKAGEIIHYSSPATLTYLRRHGGENRTACVTGNAVVTDYRLLFVSDERSHQVAHSGILGYQRRANGIEVQTSGKGAGYYEFNHNADTGTEIWIAAIGRANQTLIAPNIKNDARRIARDVRQRVWQRYGGRCAECNATHYLEFDHIIPVARGGGNSESNIQLLCRGCNSKKSDSI